MTMTTIDHQTPVARKLHTVETFLKQCGSYCDKHEVVTINDITYLRMHIVDTPSSTRHESSYIPGIGHAGKDFTVIVDPSDNTGITIQIVV